MPEGGVDPPYPVAALRRFTFGCLCAAGLPPEHAEVVTNNLMDAQVRGIDSHGVTRLLKHYVERLEAGAVNPSPSFRILEESAATALLDADNGPGAVAASFAMNLCVAKAQQQGAAWVGVRHSNHFGTASFYTNQIAAQGMVGIGFTNAPPAVAPWGGIEAHLGTNPISFSVPTRAGPPISADMATTVTAKGYILYALARGESIPLGWAQDKLGRPTTDAAAAAEGTVLPMGGHKGYALALAIDILCGALTGAGAGRSIGQLGSQYDRAQNTGHLLGAIDIARFLPLDDFLDRVEQIAEGVRSSPLAEGFDEILLPGDPEARSIERRTREGVPMPELIRREFEAMGERLGVPFEPA